MGYRAVLVSFERTIVDFVRRDFKNSTLDFVDVTDFEDFLECDFADREGVLLSSESRRLGARVSRFEALAPFMIQNLGMQAIHEEKKCC